MKKYFFMILVVLVASCFIPTKQESNNIFTAHYPAPTPFHAIDMPSVEEMIQEFEANHE